MEKQTYLAISLVYPFRWTLPDRKGDLVSQQPFIYCFPIVPVRKKSCKDQIREEGLRLENKFFQKNGSVTVYPMKAFKITGTIEEIFLDD